MFCGQFRLLFSCGGQEEFGSDAYMTLSISDMPVFVVHDAAMKHTAFDLRWISSSICICCQPIAWMEMGKGGASVR